MSQLVGVFGQDGSEGRDKLVTMLETFHPHHDGKANSENNEHRWLLSSSFENIAGSGVLAEVYSPIDIKNLEYPYLDYGDNLVLMFDGQFYNPSSIISELPHNRRLTENTSAEGLVHLLKQHHGNLEQKIKKALKDLDGTVHSIANGEIKTASNFSKSYSRVNLNISVAYGEDLDRVIKVINRVCEQMAEDAEWKADFFTAPRVLWVDNLGDSGIGIKILGDTKPVRQWAVMGELRLRLKRIFDAEGIEIPWPHTKVYLGNAIPDNDRSSAAIQESHSYQEE